MLSRRRFIKYIAASGAAFLMPWQPKSSAAQSIVTRRPRGPVRQPGAPIPGGTLDPTTITKYVTPLVIPPAMPKAVTPPPGTPAGVDYYEIAIRQFQQQILPAGMPQTPVWGYGSVDDAATFNYPAFTIEATCNKPVRVKWINQLLNQAGSYLPHLLPVDPTLHWANPAGGTDGRDSRPIFTTEPEAYTGPVPIVTHLHGGHVTEESDGYPEAWYLPAATNIPAGYATTGTYYDRYKVSSPLGALWTPDSAVYEYPNDQRATTLWYHDHALGIPRLNVYAGLAGFYHLRGGPDDLPAGVLPGPAPAPGDPPGTPYYEIPIVIQDRSFNNDGSLFFPDSRAFFDGITGPYIPDSDISPIWNPEYFGNVMVVNGSAWPTLTVEARRYRFRFLNGCNVRFLILQMAASPTGTIVPPPLQFYQIGSEGGFLPAPVALNQLLMAPAERADVIIDFTEQTPGTELLLLNLGPDEPYGGGDPDVDFPASDPDTTGQVLKFVVTAPTGTDTSTPVDQLQLPQITPLGPAHNVRQVSLNELDTEYPGLSGPIVGKLGMVAQNGAELVGVPLMWDDPVTEDIAIGDTEIWEIYNFTMDAHPIHVHLVQFEVVNREPMAGGPVRLPEVWESGLKDTVIALPGEITRFKARFDTAGLFVWHCHMLDHEDNEMMRPYRVSYRQHLPLMFRQS
jgi:spore coat protein A